MCIVFSIRTKEWIRGRDSTTRPQSPHLNSPSLYPSNPGRGNILCYHDYEIHIDNLKKGFGFKYSVTSVPYNSAEHCKIQAIGESLCPSSQKARNFAKYKLQSL